MTSLPHDRLRRYHSIARIHSGRHRPEHGLYSITEAAAMVAGEPHTLWPQSVAPTIAAFLNRAGDIASDQERQELIPLIPIILDTNDPETEQYAAAALCHTATRIWAPLTLRASQWPDMADALSQATTLQEAAATSAQLLEQLNSMKRPHGRKKINLADDLLTVCNIYASAIAATEDHPFEHDPDYRKDRTKTHRSGATIAADILGAAAQATQGQQPAQQVKAARTALHTVHQLLAPTGNTNPLQ